MSKAFLDLPAGGSGLVDRQRLVGVDVELDFGHLHVERQVQQHRARPAGAHQVEGLLEGTRHLGRLAHRDRPLGHRLGDALDVHRLEVFLVQARTRRLAGDAQDGDAVGAGRVQAGDHVGARRAAGADAHADVAGPSACEAFGHVAGGFDVARQDVGDGLPFAHRGIQRVDGRTGHAEGVGHAFPFHHQHGGHCGLHLCHCVTPGGCGSDGLTAWSAVGPTIGTPDAVICVIPHRNRPQGSANLI
jgi:hypothetical protein